MPAKELDLAVKGLTYKICVATGIKMPDDPIFKSTLIGEIKELISENEKFSDLTFSEIITAARFDVAGNFGEVSEYWNNNFNLKFLCLILTKWIDYKKNVLTKIDREIMTKNLFEQDTEADYGDDQAVQYSLENWNRTKDYMHIESRVYEILVARKQINLNQAEKARINNRAIEKVDWIFRKYYNLFSHQKYYNRCRIVISMKISVAEFFNGAPLSEANIKDRQPNEFERETYDRKMLNAL